jgi:hypothetical protein
MNYCNFFFTIVLFLSTLSSCKKNEEVGIEVQPQEDLLVVGYDGGSGIVAYSLREDSVRTDETLLNLMGSYFDPVLGVNTAGFYVQFRLPNNNVDFGTNPGVDSIALTLAYGGYYGDISTRQTVHVYEILEDYYKDSIYYSTKRLNCSASDLANTTFVPKPSDSVVIGGLYSAPHLRIKLDNSIGQKFIAASASASLTDNSSFLQFFKGLYVVAEPIHVSGAMLYFSLLNAQSKLTLYYHNDAHDSLNYTFIINENSARVTTFDHLQYSGADINFQHQIAGDTSLGTGRLYLQSMGGIKTFLRFPEIRKLIDSGNVAVNKAELIITPDLTVQGSLSLPAQLTLVKIDNDGTLGFLPDEYYGASYFGGAYSSITGEYRFNIAAYVQKLLKDGTYAGKGLYLAISGASVKGDRMIFNGPGKESGNLRLEITYTHLN